MRRHRGGGLCKGAGLAVVARSCVYVPATGARARRTDRARCLQISTNRQGGRCVHSSATEAGFHSQSRAGPASLPLATQSSRPRLRIRRPRATLAMHAGIRIRAEPVSARVAHDVLDARLVLGHLQRLPQFAMCLRQMLARTSCTHLDDQPGAISKRTCGDRASRPPWLDACAYASIDRVPGRG